jgi:4-hydroxy-tetrahydrodipicolinate reductase
MKPLRIAVAGATGKMGRALIRSISASPDHMLAAAFVRRGHSDLDRDAAFLTDGVPLAVAVTEASAAVLEGVDCLIDFTIPSHSVALAKLAADAGIADIIGTTGFSNEQETEIADTARKTRIVKSGNMSVGVTLLASLVKQAARALPEFDIEILEMHHRSKVDAPSGTALLLGKAAAAGRNIPLEENSVRARDGHTGSRRKGAIGFASLRGGTVIGEHTVVLAGAHERVTLTHVAEDRSIFAVGALAAARWIQGKPNGLYSMADVLGLHD